MSLQQQVSQLLTQYQGKRIHYFEFENKGYWLKQPEQLSGIWLLLKPQPKKAFQKELKVLQHFERIQAPVPKLVLFGENFLVLEDAGQTADSQIEDKCTALECKQQILSDCIDALVALHQRDLVHGRPALRDMTWRQGEIRFIDFESTAKSQNLQWQKARDMIIFLHSLCRVTDISSQQIQWVMQQCHAKVETNIWQQVETFLTKWRPIYRFLCLFKPIAKTDLIAIYHLFENINLYQQTEYKK